MSFPDSERMEDLRAQKIQSETPHPVMGCRCHEGRVVKHWLPPIHDCQYIRERDAKVGPHGVIQ